MPKNTSGFTIVELIIVCVIIVVLATISTMTYTGYQNQAKSQRARATAALVASAAEKYYLENGGYPDATILGVTSNNGTALNDTQRASIASTLNVEASALNVNDTQLVVCATTSCSITKSNPNYVYYVPRAQNATTTSNLDYSLESSCAIRFPGVPSATDPNAANSSYFITYLDSQTNNWKTRRSNNGTVATTNTMTCPPNTVFNDN